jgi:hypothetical protein
LRDTRSGIEIVTVGRAVAEAPIGGTAARDKSGAATDEAAFAPREGVVAEVVEDLLVAPAAENAAVAFVAVDAVALPFAAPFARTPAAVRRLAAIMVSGDTDGAPARPLSAEFWSDAASSIASSLVTPAEADGAPAFNLMTDAASLSAPCGPAADLPSMPCAVSFEPVAWDVDVGAGAGVWLPSIAAAIAAAEASTCCED